MNKADHLAAAIADFERDAAKLVAMTVLRLRTIVENPDVEPRSAWVSVQDAMKLHKASRKIVWNAALRTVGASWKCERTGRCWVNLDRLQIGPPAG